MKEKELERILKSLANKRRIAIVHFLKNQKESTVSGIAEKIRLSFRATSKHLGVLAATDIVEKDQRSSQVFYSLSANMPELAHRMILLL
ncbi:MAG: metalloregulator ArsR/SmtB family transcription factor [Patescibacteria group bacterium]